MGLGVGLRGPGVAVLGLAVVGSGDEMEMGEERRRGRPVDARLDLRRRGVGLQRVVRSGRAAEGAEPADPQGVVALEIG